MAIDEHREAYKVAMWTNEDGNKKADNIDVEQRWFIDAHANVGGGYGKDPLAGIALAWMLEKARSAGLHLKPFTAAADAYFTNPTDSFKAFAYGLYGWFKGVFKKGDGRFYRPYTVIQGQLQAVNVTIDDSIAAKWRAQPDYRPPTLVNAKIDPTSISGR